MTYGRSIKLFFDGGCRPNPGPIECAVVRKGVAHYQHDLGNGSNSDAEWLAAIQALEIAARNGDRDITLLGDSTLVVTQANRTARCRSTELKAHRAKFVELAVGFERLRIRHIGRAQNLAGIALDKLHPR